MSLVANSRYKLRHEAPSLPRRRASSAGAALPVSEFIDSYVIIDDAQDHGDGVGTMPFKLWAAQAELLAAMDAEPRLLILKARQLGISWLCCAYALHMCLFKPNRLVLTFSIGQEEANEMMRRITAMYDRLPDAIKVAHPIAKRNTEEIAWQNGSAIHALPSRKSAGSGYTASLIILDEFAKNENASKLYTAVKPTIDGGGKMIILSTANGAGNLFHDMVERSKEGASRFAFRFLPWQARPGRDQAWYASVEADAVDSSLMRQEYPATADEAFEASEVDAFLPSIQLWDACQTGIPALDAHTPCVLALDGAESNDTFASVIVSSWGEGVGVRYVRPYVPSPGIPLDFDAIEADIRALCTRYAIQEIAYDPFLLGQLIRRLTTGPSAINVPCTPFHQGAERLESDKALYDLITSRRLAHDGNVELRAHISNSNRKIDTEGRRLRIVKRTYQLKIDLAVALSMGAARIAGLVPRNITEGANFLADWRG